MLTVKFVKYLKQYDRASDSQVPCATEHVVIYSAPSVHLSFEKDGRQVVQLGDAPEITVEFTVGSDRPDVQYHAAYVMNENGKTVDTIR